MSTAELFMLVVPLELNIRLFLFVTVKPTLTMQNNYTSLYDFRNTEVNITQIEVKNMVQKINISEWGYQFSIS